MRVEKEDLLNLFSNYRMLQQEVDAEFSNRCCLVQKEAGREFKDTKWRQTEK